ncbi:MAG: class I poly(R)-hydroxyalkanoic acid synthase [Pseudomonadota bacterium]|nr:class I poly(R)-hydroxyalkanoic acid synthase [Pseudomonadota bacterium]
MRRAEIEERYRCDLATLWQRTLDRAHGARVAPVIEPEAGDRRFAAPEWRDLPYFDWVKQAYLLYSRALLELADTVQLDAKAAGKLRFCTHRYLDALAPTNCAVTNPQVLKRVIESNGHSLALGLRNLLLDTGRGRLSMSDETAFDVGRNLAITSGAVICENELMQLIQYAPLRDHVHARPLLIVPPCISKYYMLDLQPDNSFVRYCVESGYTVFLISWRNVTPAQGSMTWDDYLSLGVLVALDAACEITGSDSVNALGFCVGGAMLACAVAVLHAKGQRRVQSVTLLATMLDYEASGDLGLLIDDAYVKAREATLTRETIVAASEVAMSFASLRANEFIWHYVIHNYLMGETPPPLDLLYWNGDQANLPGAMFAWYIRNLYLENNLVRPGALSMCATPVDLRAIDVPSYIFGARDDHIAPWKCAYASAQLLRGDRRFVLGASGHVAGVINPPSRNRRQYWIGGESSPDPERWLATAQAHPGSWWTHWRAWIEPYAGPTRDANPTPGSARYREIEPAPGRYVRVRA